MTLGVGGTRDYTWGAAGHLKKVDAAGNVIDFTNDDAGRLSSVSRTLAAETASFAYDGRSYLTTAAATAGGTESVTPLYDSAGLLHALRRQDAPASPEELIVHFYLAGRLVAQVAIDGGTGAETWTYVTPDHLGTPMLATDDAGVVVWEGAFEPFGTDYQAGTAAGASENGIYLRLPGQWNDGTWDEAASGAGMYYNVRRWYQPGIGRYTKVDPVGIEGGLNLYAYASLSPVVFVDPMGLTSYKGFSPDEEAALKRGVEEARRRLEECCAGDDSQQLLDMLEKATFVANDSLLSRTFFKGCAEVNFRGFLTNTIRVDPRALTDPGWKEQCCAPGGMVVHEVTHLTGGGYWREGPAYDNQFRCFGCTGSIAMQDHLKRNPTSGGGGW